MGMLLFSISSYAQKDTSYSNIDMIIIKNGHVEEALYYYDQNWKMLREKAVEAGYIESYQFLQALEEPGYDLLLITNYGNRSNFEHREENFQKLMDKYQPDGVKLLNDIPSSEFRAFGPGTTAKALARSKD